MKLHTNTCKLVKACHRKTSICNTYRLNNACLPPVSCYNYLGIHIASNLSWVTHIVNVARNANRILSDIKRNFSSSPQSLKQVLYVTLVRAKPGYASSMWDPGYGIVINSLAAVWNKAARFMLANHHRAVSVTAMKATLQLSNLAIRRNTYRPSLFYIIYRRNQEVYEELLMRPFFSFF